MLYVTITLLYGYSSSENVLSKKKKSENVQFIVKKSENVQFR